jgi:hypothetical protein
VFAFAHRGRRNRRGLPGYFAELHGQLARIVSALPQGEPPMITTVADYIETIPTGSIRPAFIHDYEENCCDDAHDVLIGRFIETFAKLPLPLAAQLIVEQAQLLPAERQREIAALLGAN